MSLIRDILGLSGVDKTQNSTGAKRNNSAKNVKSDTASRSVNTNISPEAKHLLELKSEASQFLDKVKSAQTITPEEIDQIKERITSQYYFDSQVIDQIVDKMLRTVKVSRLK
ncbi:hypothetical protein [Caldithrix abyssi]|uniref:Anti-sigma-28 factor FlgM C-terminal domain-containing protein n=1 Tax=Caldithrix abyssi DSM 13497 TaxID=880073 RepID=H1XPA2_CALAY|nr:hypothetical protein [Caldithrix abyssi]APF18189.1 hypothetical protein Cabys_1440 [Caldithrix abyssi DSM 13497]EHO42217.1 hypothetical protein Calab_2607 [Caldithrix abyssi DSM 13497]